jgi:hypothetical protein
MRFYRLGGSDTVDMHTDGNVFDIYGTHYRCVAGSRFEQVIIDHVLHRKVNSPEFTPHKYDDEFRAMPEHFGLDIYFSYRHSGSVLYTMRESITLSDVTMEIDRLELSSFFMRGKSGLPSSLSRTHNRVCNTEEIMIFYLMVYVSSFVHTSLKNEVLHVVAQAVAAERLDKIDMLMEKMS